VTAATPLDDRTKKMATAHFADLAHWQPRFIRWPSSKSLVMQNRSVLLWTPLTFDFSPRPLMLAATMSAQLPDVDRKRLPK
jgi:hypothetical protein